MCFFNFVMFDGQPFPDIEPPGIIGDAGGYSSHLRLIQLKAGDACEHDCQLIPLIQIPVKTAQDQRIKNNQQPCVLYLVFSLYFLCWANSYSLISAR